MHLSCGVTGTEVAATTIHALLDLNPDMESKLDFTKGNPKTAVLMNLDVLFIDEVRLVFVDMRSNCSCRLSHASI